MMTSSRFCVTLIVLGFAWKCAESARIIRAVSTDAPCVSASVIVTATVKSCQITHPRKYSCTVQIWNIMKGKGVIPDLLRVQDDEMLNEAFERTFAEIHGLGNPSFCKSDVKEGNTRIFFANRVEGRLVLSASVLRITLKNLENTEKVIEACSLDVMFVLDGSGSVSPSNFELVKDWVKTTGQRLQENHDNVQLGVIQYSHYYAHRSIDDQPLIKTEVSLEHRSVSNFSAEVDLIRHMGYTTHTAHGLQLAIKDFNTSVNYKAAGNNQILILVTDGRSTDPYMLQETAEEVRRLGITPYAVGIGDAFPSELREIATGNQSSSERVSSVGDVVDLRSLVLDLDIC